MFLLMLIKIHRYIQLDKNQMSKSPVMELAYSNYRIFTQTPVQGHRKEMSLQGPEKVRRINYNETWASLILL